MGSKTANKLTKESILGYNNGKLNRQEKNKNNVITIDAISTTSGWFVIVDTLNI